MRRLSRILSGTVLVGVVVTAIPGPARVSAQAALPAEVADNGYADIILYNAKVVSMDDSGVNENPGHVYEAIAVKRNVIMALGASDRIRAMAGPKTRVIDAAGRFIMPGIIESHAHIYGNRRIAQQLGLKAPDTGVAIVIRVAKDFETTRALIAKRVGEEVAKLQPGDWVHATLAPNPKEGITSNAVWAWVTADVIASKDLMDKVAPNNPVLVQAGPRGNLNSKGFDAAEALVPHFKEFVRQSIGDAYVENIDKGFVGVAAMESLTWDVWYRKAPTSVAAEIVRRDLEMAAAHGVTTFSSRVPHPRILDSFVWLGREGQLPVRFAALMEVHRRPTDPNATRQFYKMTGNLTGLGDDHLWIHGVASEFWDSLYPFACLGPDFVGDPKIKRREQCPQPGELWYDTLHNALSAGWRLAGIHGVGSHGVRLFIQMVESVMKETGMTVQDVRKLGLTIEHAEVLGTRPDVMQGLAKYGIIVSACPCFMNSKAEYVKDYGSEAESFIVPVRSLAEGGIKVVGQNHSYHQIGFLWKRFMDREVKGSTVNAKEAVDRVTVLKMWTTWPAEYVRKQDRLGTLEVGKFADILVLDRDLLTIPVADITKVRPQMTLLDGQVKYLSSEFAASAGMAPVGYQFPKDYEPWGEMNEFMEADQ